MAKEQAMYLDIRGLSIETNRTLHEYAQRRFSYALDRFEDRLRTVMVRLSDIDGRRGGVDTRCVVEVRFTHGDRLVVQYVGENAYVAIDQISSRLKRTIARHLTRRRTKTRSTRGLATAMA